jgi:hypothetical protein
MTARGFTFNRRLYGAQAPKLNATPRVLLRSLEIAQIVPCDSQSAVTSYHERSVVLLLREPENASGKLHRDRHLVGVERE